MALTWCSKCGDVDSCDETEILDYTQAHGHGMVTVARDIDIDHLGRFLDANAELFPWPENLR